MTYINHGPQGNILVKRPRVDVDFFLECGAHLIWRILDRLNNGGGFLCRQVLGLDGIKDFGCFLGGHLCQSLGVGRQGNRSLRL